MVYFLAIIGMICWGISPIFAKIGLKNISPLAGLAVRTIFTAIVIMLWMTLDGSIVQLKFISTKSIFFLILEATLATLIGDLAYFAALKKGSPSIVMLIMACSPVATIVCSALFLGERISIQNIIGAVLIIAGIFLVV